MVETGRSGKPGSGVMSTRLRFDVFDVELGELRGDIDEARCTG